MNKYPTLFTPGRIGTVATRNRLVMAPMGITGALVGSGGTYSERAIAYFERRAKGEVGLIVTGLNLVNTKIEPWEIEGTSFNIAFDSLWKVQNFIELTERVHTFGAKIFTQLTAGFGRVFPGTLAKSLARQGVRPVAASATPLFWAPDIMARELTTGEVDALVEAFGHAALIARESQFDGIELHGHEGYLMDQFTSALWNRRTDRYGGDLRGRMTFPLAIIDIIRERAGADFPIIYRYGAEHKIPGGRGLGESIEMAKMLESAGVAALHVDAGCYDNWFWPHPPIYQPPGCMVDMAAAIKPHVSVPVIAVGRLGYPWLAEDVLVKGMADFVAVGRPLLADPDFAAKARRGEDDEIRPCIGCHECLARIPRRQGLTCAVNPQCADEARLEIHAAPTTKKVLVIGGGLAGMEAARVCGLRGHDVVLVERTSRLGGALHVAGWADFKHDIQALLRQQVLQLAALENVAVRLDTEVDAAMLEAEKPDVVFVATGATAPENVHIENLSSVRWLTAYDVNADSVDVTPGLRVCVVGAGSLGCETAIQLADWSAEVVLVGRRDTVAHDLFEPNQAMLVEMLRDRGVRVLTGGTVRRAEDGAVFVQTATGEERIETDLIVLASGRRPLNTLVAAARSTVKEVYVVGDCVAPRKIKDAIWEGFKLAAAV